MNPSDANELPTNLPVTVCVPTYNNGETIERCLRSVLDQEGVEFEIVVVDDGSSDESASIAARMLRPGDRLIRNESRVGLNENHNKCLEHARGRCIQFVHGDDWLLPGALRTMSGCFDDPSIGMAFALRRVMTDDLKWKSRYDNLQTRFRGLRARNDGPSLVRQMALHGANGNWIGEPTCVMFRHRLALHAGGFRNDIYQLVDLDLWDRLMLRSTVCFVPQELSVRCHTGATETTRVMNTRRFWLDQLHILTWLVMDPASPTVIRIVAAAWWLPAWLKVFLETVVFGPQRRSRLKIWAMAPLDEFTRARRLRDDTPQLATVP
jgi:glycosyltransferase involved in cell wall biosynthesis